MTDQDGMGRITVAQADGCRRFGGRKKVGLVYLGGLCRIVTRHMTCLRDRHKFASRPRRRREADHGRPLAYRSYRGGPRQWLPLRSTY